MNVTLRQLRAFIAVAAEKSFTRAADKLDLSQSSVSTLIQELEANLALRLFDRHTRLLVITQVGAEILPLVKKAVADIDSVIMNSGELRTLGRGRVSIAASSIQAALLLPRFINQFSRQYPGVSVELHDVAEHEVPKMVRSGEVDFGIGTEYDSGLDLSARLLSADNFVVIMRPDDPLTLRGELRWHDLVNVPIIGPRRGNPIRERLDHTLAKEGIVLSRFHEVYLALTMVGMVEGGLGIAVMSTSATKLATALGLVIRKVTHPVIKREVSLLFHADRSLSPTAQRFRDLLLQNRMEISES